MFDKRNIYVASRVWDSAPPSAWVANEMRRDTSQLRQNDTFAVVFDTFYDPQMVLDDRMASVVEAHRKVVELLRLVTVGFLRDHGLEPSSELPVVDEPVAVES